MVAAAPYSRSRSRTDEPEWPVLALVVLALVAGLFLQFMVVSRLESATFEGGSLSYPAQWSRTAEGGALFAATESEFGSTFAPRVAVRAVERSELMTPEGSLYDAASSWVLARTDELQGYRALGIQPTRVGNLDALNVEGAYLANPRQGSASLAMPALMRVVDTILLHNDQVYVITFAAEADEFDQLTSAGFPRFRNLHEAVLQSVRLP